MTVDFRNLLVGQTFQVAAGTVWCDYAWTVIESRLTEGQSGDAWRIVATRPWEFGTHTVTQDYPIAF